MTVAELMAELSNLPKDLEIRVRDTKTEAQMLLVMHYADDPTPIYAILQ